MSVMSSSEAPGKHQNLVVEFLVFNPSDTKSFGTCTKHQGREVGKDPTQYLNNEKCYKPETFGGARSVL